MVPITGLSKDFQWLRAPKNSCSLSKRVGDCLMGSEFLSAADMSTTVTKGDVKLQPATQTKCILNVATNPTQMRFKRYHPNAFQTLPPKCVSNATTQMRFKRYHQSSQNAFQTLPPTQPKCVSNVTTNPAKMLFKSYHQPNPNAFQTLPPIQLIFHSMGT